MEQIAAPRWRASQTLRVLALALTLVAIVAIGAIIAFHNAAAGFVLRSAGHTLGYQIGSQTLNVGLTRTVATNVRVEREGEPVFAARRVAVNYALRDLLPGGNRLFGLESVDVAQPHITLIHHLDGSYNLHWPAAAQQNATPNGPPLDVAFRISDGTVDLIDRFVAVGRERRERFIDVQAGGAISPSTASKYRAGAVLELNGKRYPILGNARFADARGFEEQHWTAARLPIAGLADFVLSTHALVVQAGDLERLDIKLGALTARDGGMQSHLGISGTLRGARLAVAAIAKPVRDAHGTFVIDDTSASVRSLDATLNGMPLHLSGALFNFAAPQVAFALRARGELARLRQLSPDVAKIPLSGTVAVQGLAEGPAANPLILGRLGSAKARYGAYRFDGVHGLVAIAGQEVDVLGAAIRYGKLAVGGRGAVRLARHTSTTAYATVNAPGNTLPYVENIVPGMPLAATAVVRGTDSRIGARGYLGGSAGGDRLDLPFAIAPDGSGTVGPAALQRRDGASVYARAVLDRAARQTVAIVDVKRFSLLPAPPVALSGLAIAQLPTNFDAKLDATFAALASGTTLRSANGKLHAYGSWGDLRGYADGSATRLAARGRLISSFERLAAFTGKIGAQGRIDAPFALTNVGRKTIVQVAGAQLGNASIRGIPLGGVSATLGIGSGAVDVYSADLQAAGRHLTAQGSFGHGGHVHITAGDVDLRALRAVGLAVADGRATVIADLGGTYIKPTANVLGAVTGARYAGTIVGGDAGLAYDGAALHVDRATVTYGGAYANAAGTVFGLALGHVAPRYDLRAALEDADIATLAHTVKTPLRYPEGTVNADLRIRGAGARPTLTGALQIPEGSLNGLNFRDARIRFNGDPNAVRADGGRITVGETTLGFGGSASRTQQSVRLRSARLDLADFDDYFDEAEVLAGTGSVALALDAAPQRFNTSANVALDGVRYRRFALGKVNATIRTVGTAVRLRANVAGMNGRASLSGSVNVPATDALRDIARRSYVDLRGQVAGINLGNVLPAAGISAPVLGTIDGSAVVHGRYPALALSTYASLSHGVVGRLPIARLRIAATAANGRARLTDATLVAPGLNASVRGTFGLRATDAFDLRGDATSADINTLAAAATGRSAGIRGALDTHARLRGTIANPRLVSSIDLNALTYAAIAIPKAHADIDATRRAVDVRNGSIALPRSGTIAFDGHAPLGSGPRTPIALDFTPHNVNVNPYSSLLPDGSVIQGIFDGNVGVRGTLSAPQLAGRLTFSGGSYRSNTVKLPLTAIALELDFAGTTVQIVKLHARAIPGNFDGVGSVSFGDLRDPLRGLSANINVKATNALVSAPKYYVGYIEGNVAVTKRVAAPTLVGGDLTFSSARIPYTALVPSGPAATGPAPALPDVAFDLGVKAGRDVRIQSGPVDIGTTGGARLGGTLAKPTLDGQFSATDGTVAVYRTFTVQNGSAVSFNPSDGITPSVDATAVTHVPDPSTDVLLRITGLSTHLSLAFSSEPVYSQQQILGLLVNAQALGAVSGVAQTSGSAAGSSGPSITGLGEGLLNDQLAKAFLAPITSKLGGALGLSDLNINYSTNGAVSAIARRAIGKNVSFTYGEQIGGPTPRTSVGINIGSSIAGAQLTFYQAAGGSQAFGGQSLTPYLQSGFLATSAPNYALQAIEPPNGSGFVFSYQRHFWSRSH